MKITQVLKISVEGTLPDLNRIIDTAKIKKNSYAAYRSMKKDYDFLVRSSCPSTDFLITRIDCVHMHWVSENRRIDKDNIRAGVKFILDGMEGKILTKDGYKNVGGFRDTFALDKENPRVEVTLFYQNENTIPRVEWEELCKKSKKK